MSFFLILICGRRETLSSLPETLRRRCAPLLSLQNDPRIGREGLLIYSIGFSTVLDDVRFPNFDLRAPRDLVVFTGDVAQAVRASF